MKTSVTKLLQRTTFVFVATLIVAVHPAIASADTTESVATTPTTTQSSTAADAAQPPAATPPVSTLSETAPVSPSDTPKPEADAAPADQPKAPDPNSVAPTTTSTTNAGTTTKAGVQNTLDSKATSGNATIVNNTTAGDATSGSAEVNNTSINMLQSSAGFGGGSTIATFTKDIDGNQTGDILLNPDLLASIAVTPSSNPPTNLTVTSQTSGQIHNTINLDAESGNATVANNGSAGNATTGDANAVANIVNVVNSMVGADHTFVGTVNINGNLDGDILLPDVMQNLLGSAALTDGNLDLHNATTQSVANNATTSARSGDATVTNNGHAGNATTGEAKTNVTIMNLSGAQAVGKDSIVVFVNILGSWVGFIVDSPTGADSAVLGDGVTSSNPATGDTVINNNSDASIVNDVHVNAASGNATVANNGMAGSATTGKATASANILNLTNSSLSMGGWFGILFINVFGSWHGSFGVDTAAGSPPQQLSTPPSGDTTAGTNNPTQTFVAAAHFVPTTANDPSDISTPTNDPTKHKDVLSASTVQFIPPTLHTNSNHWELPAAGLAFSVLLVLCEIILSRRKKLHTTLQGITN